MLSDATLQSLVIEPKKPPIASYSDCSTMTDKLKTEDKQVDPMERRSIAVETEVDNMKASAEGVMISEEIITLLETMIHDSATSRIYDRLLPFHSTNLVQLQPIRTYSVSLLSIETLNVVSLSCGSAGRIAILIGETDHVTWCGHEGKIIISQRSTSTSIPLAVCPSSSSWSPQGVLAVGDVAGDVHIFIGDVIVSTAKIHSQAVSALEWISNSQLFSCGNDGNVTISQLKGTLLENIKTLRISVSDMPRCIRKSSSLSKPVSIVAMSRCDEDVCIATETGGLWIVSLPDLHLKVIPSEPQPILTVAYIVPFIAVSGDEDSTILMNSDGTFIESFAIEGSQMCKIEEFMIFADGSRILIYDVTTRKVVLDENRSVRSMCVTPLGDIVVLSENELFTLRLVKSNA